MKVTLLKFFKQKAFIATKKHIVKRDRFTCGLFSFNKKFSV
ncbi:hypothetical protein LACWKB10_1315 [Lactobacillus sp. wkB10]|nr:hypothetical protein LACWKB10_1315 [Lactobacillus sp. wkB10]